MDSPQRSQIITSASQSTPLKDSPFFNYLSNLSPIKPVKGVRAAQGFTELNFPPPVFTSPRIISQREAGFLKRSTCPQLSSTDLFLENDSRNKLVIADSRISNHPSVIESAVGLESSSPKGFDSKCTVQGHSGSPSGSVDEYLVDHVEVEDSANFTGLSVLNMKQVHDDSQEAQGVCNSSKETSAKLDAVGESESQVNSRIFEQPEVGSTENVNDISEKVNDQGEPIKYLVPVSGSHQCSHIEEDTAPEDFFFLSKNKERDFVKSVAGKRAFSESLCYDGSQHNVDGDMLVKLDSTPQLRPEDSPCVQAYKSYDERSGVISKGSFENSALYDSEEGSQHQHGTRRRCLQFEAAEAQGNPIRNSCITWKNPTNHLFDSKSPQTPDDVEIMHSSRRKFRLTSSGRKPASSSQPVTSRLTIRQLDMPEMDRSARSSGSSSVLGPIPSGIGLHLNSIVNAAVTGCDTVSSTKNIENEYSSAHRETTRSLIEGGLLGDLKNCVLEGQNFANNDSSQQKNLTITSSSSTTFESSHHITRINSTMQFELIQHDMTPRDKAKSSSEDADRFEEFSQPSSQKKRKKMSYSIENDGCKRCNCKKSKCLKLYCECFAAGVYCSDPCSCLECFNKPEYEDTVLGTRQQIESRNPLAFAPKVVPRVGESPVNSGEDGSQMILPSAKHKRGCNCKKSMCTKKYCECYQAGVGCSVGCRCEGCKNSFGIKEGYCESKDLFTKGDTERWEDSSDDKLDLAKIRSDLVQPEQHQQNLSPLTPLFQFSDHRKEPMKSQIIVRRYVPSPESDRPKTSERTLNIVLYGQGSECNSVGRVDHVLPRQDEFADIYNLTPLAQASSTVLPSSSSNSRCGTKVSRAKYVQANASLSSVTPLRWRGSPITPLPQLGRSKFPCEPDSDSRLDEILEDDTPDILKDSQTPIKAVKVSSPNKKRVSPPHKHVKELRSSASPSLKSGRKFVLRSISAFPPLTPHSDVKSSNDK